MHGDALIAARDFLWKVSAVCTGTSYISQAIQARFQNKPFKNTYKNRSNATVHFSNQKVLKYQTTEDGLHVNILYMPFIYKNLLVIKTVFQS